MQGDVYTFGCGMFGQLGTGTVLKQSYPQKVDIPERIQQIASGHFHVVSIIKFCCFLRMEYLFLNISS